MAFRVLPGEPLVDSEKIEAAEMREALLARVGGVALFYAQLRQRVAVGVCEERDLWQAATVNHEERRDAA